MAAEQTIDASRKKSFMTELLRHFDSEYSFLYDNHDNVAGYRDALDAFDDFFALHRPFVTEFIRLRGDYLSSDRECAAFMFAVSDMGNEPAVVPLAI